MRLRYKLQKPGHLPSEAKDAKTTASSLLEGEISNPRHAPGTHLNDVIVEEEPEAVALDDGDVVASVGPTEEDKHSMNE